jgi:hypothetical protein
MWRNLMNGRWGAKDHRTALIAQAQNMIALEGYFYYAARQMMVERTGAYVLFEPNAKDFFDRINGLMQEFDAAIVLLDAVRRHTDWIMVPAPLQFERTRAQTNVDMVVINLARRRAIGVQVKTTVRQSHLDQADTDRVIFVDGNLDFNNVRAMRTQRGRSAEKVVPWPGLVSIKRASVMQTQGKASAGVLSSSFYAARTKQQAQRLVGDLRIDYREMSARIAERIAAHL